MALKFEIVIPSGIVYKNEDCASIVLPTSAGEIEVLPGHIPLTTEIVPGEIVVKAAAGTPTRLAVDKGYARIIADTISVLAEAAIDVESIDLNAVETARERAELALQKAREQGTVDPAEIERLEAIARFAIAQKLAKK